MIELALQELVKNAFQILKSEIHAFVGRKRSEKVKKKEEKGNISEDKINSLYEDCLRALDNLDKIEVKKKLKKHAERILDWSNSLYFREMPHSKDLKSSYIQLNTFLTPCREHISKSEKKKTIPAEKLILNTSGNLLIYGGAGSGKTTTIKRLIQIYYKDKPKEFRKHKGLCLLRFRDMQTTSIINEHVTTSLRKILSFELDLKNTAILEKEPDFRSKIEEKLNEQFIVFQEAISMLVLLDGFDEIPDSETKDNVITELSEISRLYPKIKIIMTCRTGEIQYGPANFSEYEIAPLSNSQIKSFLSTWTNTKTDISALLTNIQSKGYQGSSTKPINLAYICSVYERTGDIPRYPRDLFRKIVDIMVTEWDEERFIRRKTEINHFNSNRKREFLRSIAYTASVTIGTAVFGKSNLKVLYDSVRRKFRLKDHQLPMVFQELEAHTGIFVQSGFDSFEFHHKTIQEYLAAEYLINLGAFPKGIPTNRTITAELAMAIALSSNSTEYLCEVISNFFVNSETSENQIQQLIERLLLEDVVLDGDEGGFDIALFLISLAITGSRTLTVKEIVSAAQQQEGKAFRRLDKAFPWTPVLVEGDWERYCFYFHKRFRYIPISELRHHVLFEPKKTADWVLPFNFNLLLPKNIYRNDIQEAAQIGKNKVFGS